MPRKLRVHGWGGWWFDDRNPGTHQQARYIMAATSIAEIKRLVGKNSLWNICETGNAGEISLATPKPLTLFVVPCAYLTFSKFEKGGIPLADIVKNIATRFSSLFAAKLKK